MKTLYAAGAFALLASTLPAHAVIINVTEYSAANYTAVTDTFAGTLVETFEGFPEGNVPNGFSTSVGEFSTLGGTGTGGTVAGFDGSLLAVRDGNVFGRSSTTQDIFGGTPPGMFLDSNDTWGISWAVSAGTSVFNQLVFVMTDATDVGKAITVFADDGTVQASVTFPGKTFAPSERRLVHILFDDYVSSAQVNLDYAQQINDGVSIDDITLAAVPLPAPALLLIGGLSALGAMRARKKRAEA